MMRLKVMALGFAAMWLAGCSSMQMYDGPKQSDSAVVKINGMSSWDVSAGGLAVKVCKFDGKALDSCQPFIDFMPGTHTLTIELTNLGIKVGDDVDVVKDFFAGEQCELDVRFSGSSQSPVLMCPRPKGDAAKPASP